MGKIAVLENGRAMANTVPLEVMLYVRAGVADA